MQPDPAFGSAFLARNAPEHDGLLVQRLHPAFVTGEGAKLGHLGQHHGDDVQRVDLVFRKLAGGFRLHDKDAQLFTNPLDRHAKEGGEQLLPRLGHVAKALFGRCVGGVDRQSGSGDAANKAFAQLHPGFVNGVGVQPFGGAKLQRFGIAEQVDGANLGADAVSDEVGDVVKPVLPLAGGGKAVAQAAEEFSAVAFGAFRHRASLRSGVVCFNHRCGGSDTPAVCATP